MTLKLTSSAPWYRLFQSRYPNPLGYGFGSSRFSDPEVTVSPPDRFGVVYFGSSIKVCFAEAILRERAVGSKGSFPIGIAELQEVSCASIEINQPLLLADLRSDGMCACAYRLMLPVPLRMNLGSNGQEHSGSTTRNRTGSSTTPA
ncbi:RES family NAD+ phosphorylase [Rhizobium jaguaris]|uniref:RES family NAD+ phosphorylase n=1 Tax=Rhizobium jaguaris TaxID=1312183 RepID=UPI00247885B3|nr:RES family NAD+ phosphorylase [Rhizobium jaguaris]